MPVIAVMAFSVSAFVVCAGCTTSGQSAEDACTSESWQAVAAEKKGDYAGAENHFLQAVEQAQRCNSALQLPKELQELAQLYMKEQKWTQAETTLRRALKRYNTIEKENRLVTANRLDMSEGRLQTLEALAAVLSKEGKPGDAEQFYKEALALNKNSGGQVDSNLRISRNYVDLLKSQHKDKEAGKLQLEAAAANMTAMEVNRNLDREKVTALYESDPDPFSSVSKLETLALVSERLGKKDRVQQALYFQGMAHLRSGKVEQAQTNFRKCIAILKSEKIGGINQTLAQDMAMDLAAVACCLEIEGKSEQAADVYKQALDAHFHTAGDTIKQIASQSLKNGKDDYALLLTERLFIIAEESKKDKIERLFMVKTINWLGSEFAGQHKYAQAMNIHKRLRAISEKAAGSASEEVATALYGSAEDYRSQGKYIQAEPIYKRAVSIYEKIPAADSLSKASALYAWGQNCLSLKNFGQAQLLFNRALPIFKKTKDAQMNTAFTYDCLADTCQEQHKLAQAEAARKAALAIVEKVYGANDHEVAKTLEALADNYCLQGRKAEAEPVYKRALAIYEKTNAEHSPEVAAVAAKLAALTWPAAHNLSGSGP